MQMCSLTPPHGHKPMMAKQGGLEMDPTVMAVRDSLNQMTAPPRPSPVTAFAGDGGDAAPAGAQGNWVQRCPVTPLRRQTPAVPAKQASLAMESTVTTVRGSPGLASLGPGSVVTAAGKGGGAAAAGER